MCFTFNIPGHVFVSQSRFSKNHSFRLFNDNQPVHTLLWIQLQFTWTRYRVSFLVHPRTIIYPPVDPPRLPNDNQQVHTLLRIMLLHIHMHYSPLSTRFCGSIYCTHTCNFITNKFTRFCESCHCISTCNLITIVHTLLRINLLHSHMHFQHCPHTLVDQFIASQGCSHTLVNHPCSHFHPIHTHRWIII